MALEAERRAVGAREALQRAVEQRDVGDAAVGRQRVGVDREAVVLRGDHDLPAVEVLDRVVGAVVSEFHFECACARSERHDLMAEADAESGDAALDDVARGGDGVVARPRVARPVGQEHPVRIERQRFGRAGPGRQHRHLAAALGEHAQDIGLDAEIVGDDVKARRVLAAVATAQAPFGLAPLVALLDRDDLGQVHAGQAGEAARQRDRLVGAGADGDGAVLGPLGAQDAGQLAGVDAGDGHDALLLQAVRQRLGRAEVRGQQRQVLDHQAGRVHARRFAVFAVDAGVADVGIGQGDDLARVAGVGQDFLVAGHGRVEDDFSGGVPFGADRVSEKGGAVGQGQDRLRSGAGGEFERVFHRVSWQDLCAQCVAVRTFCCGAPNPSQ